MDMTVCGEADQEKTRMKRFLKWTGLSLASLVVLWTAVGIAMTYSPAPTLLHPQKQASAGRSDVAACRDADLIRCFTARDGVRLSARLLETGNSETLVLFLHGVLASSAKHTETARLLHETLGATVVSLDLRGHGLSEGTPGDVDRIGQYEDDVADVVATLRRERPGARVLLSGHSMGGGIALRYADRAMSCRSSRLSGHGVVVVRQFRT